MESARWQQPVFHSIIITVKLFATSKYLHYGTSVGRSDRDLTDFHPTNRLQRKADPPAAIEKTKTVMIESLKARKTDVSICGGVTCLTPVAPASMICWGLRPGIAANPRPRLLEKIFWATDTLMLEPKVIKKPTIALPTGTSVSATEHCTARSGIWNAVPAPAPANT